MRSSGERLRLDRCGGDGMRNGGNVEQVLVKEEDEDDDDEAVKARDRPSRSSEAGEDGTASFRGGKLFFS